MKTDWDYSDRAHTYDARADYSEVAVFQMLRDTQCKFATSVADIGAGTGKLSKLLLRFGLEVHAVEPNDNMRSYGVKNTEDEDITWTEGTGEHTGLLDASVHAAYFGSSFNVVNQSAALEEVNRILTKDGWFGCLWNHRDTEDPVQKGIENIIHDFIPDYNYGVRREDPSPVINNANIFGPVNFIEERFAVCMKRQTVIDAWRSHDTLYRQSDGKFEQIMDNIATLLEDDEIEVPYFTRIWYAQKRTD